MSVMRLFILLLASCMGMGLHAQQPARTNNALESAPTLEYFFDNDPGYGKGNCWDALTKVPTPTAYLWKDCLLVHTC